MPRPGDPRAAALARYLRETAARFSLSADATDGRRTGEAGMAMLDAALIAEAIPASDPRLRMLSEAGLFESMPDGESLFLENPEIRRALWRPLVSDHESGAAIITKLMATVAAFHEPSAPTPHQQSGAGATPRRRIPLQALRDHVSTTRSALRRHRTSPASASLESARHDLVLALENYVSALEDRNLPVPRSIHTELTLHKGLLRWWQ